jgi:hypothetical protein
MEITIRISDQELGEALTAYLKARGLSYVAHQFIDDNVLQIAADVGVAPAAPAPAVLPAQAPHVAAAPRDENPTLSLTELRTYDPDAVQDRHYPQDAAADELAAVLREMGQLPVTPPGLAARRR